MKNQNITVNLKSRAYEIAIAPGAIKDSKKILAPYVQDKKCFIISDSNVFPLYGKQAISELKNANGIIAGQFIFPAGEKSKTLSTVEQIYSTAIGAGLDRSSTIIALGGGVVGDIAGFVAATYMRGIDFIQIPTSLLAMVDSSVGGKTGVDLPEGKNLIGAFWQPKFVLIDPKTLDTLPEREVKGGLAEVVKYGIILDHYFFDELKKNVEKINTLDTEFYSKIISRSCNLKAKIVEEDECEGGIRAILNYGHTFGHAIETVAGFGNFIHGEAVAIGMLMAAELACSMNIMKREELQRIIELCEELNLPSSANGIDPNLIFEAMAKDKKTKNGKINFILPEKIGKVTIMADIEKKIIIDAIKKHI